MNLIPDTHIHTCAKSLNLSIYQSQSEAGQPNNLLSNHILCAVAIKQDNNPLATYIAKAVEQLVVIILLVLNLLLLIFEVQANNSTNHKTRSRRTGVSVWKPSSLPGP